MALLNYTTTITADKSVAEIQRILSRAGAKAILTEFDGDGEIAALSFQVAIEGATRGFTLPANVEGVFKVLGEQKRRGKLNLPSSRITRDQARRVAWRILKDWVEAQMALIESNQVTLDQVFLPYLQVGHGRSLYQAMVQNHLALPSGE